MDTQKEDTYKPLLPYEEIKPMTENDYDKYLEQKIIGFNEGGISGYAGPMLIKFVKYNSESQNAFGIEAYLAPIPNMIATGNSFYHPFSIRISGIFDKNGNDIADNSGKWEGYNKETKEYILNLQYMPYPSPHIYTNDLVYEIISGKTAEDIAEVKGTIYFSLPIDMQKISLTKKEKGYETKRGKAVWKLKEFEPNKIEIEVTEEVGKDRQIVNHKIINHIYLFLKEKGFPMWDYFSYNSSFSTKNNNNLGVEILTLIFNDSNQAPIDHVDLILYDGPVVKSYDFTLTKHVDTPEYFVRKPLNDAQKEIAQSLVDLKKIIDSKDKFGLIEYLRQQVLPENMAIFEEKDVKYITKNPEEMLTYFSKLLFAQGPETCFFSFDLLDTNAVAWEIGEDTAKLIVSPKDYQYYGCKAFQTLTFIKKDSKWYFSNSDIVV